MTPPFTTIPLWALILGPASLLFSLLLAFITFAPSRYTDWLRSVRMPMLLREALIVIAVVNLCYLFQNEVFQTVLCAAYLLYVGFVRLNLRRSRTFR